MAYLKKPEYTTVKMPSDPEYWVKLRTRAKWVSALEAQGAMMKISTEQSANTKVPDQQKIKVLTEPEWAGYVKALVLGYIEDWNLTDENDEKLPINLESLALLEEEDGDVLSDFALARSKSGQRTVEQERNLGTNSRRQFSTARR